MRSANYGNDWPKRGSPLKPVGIIVAPEIFQVQQRIYRPNGKVLMEEMKYFTWETARELIANGNTPAGWRMMTATEAEAIKDHYNNSRFGRLVFGLDGFITPDNMTAYKYYPAGYNHLVASQGVTGYYWLDDCKSTARYASAVEVSGSEIRVTTYYMGYGLPLVLVKDI